MKRHILKKVKGRQVHTLSLTVRDKKKRVVLLRTVVIHSPFKEGKL